MWAELTEDYRRYPGRGLRRFGRAAISQGFWAVVAFRISSSVQSLPPAIRMVVKVIWLPLAKAVECATGVQIGATARVGPGLYVGHFGCIVVSAGAVLGARCNISQGVTIGAGGRGAKRGAPILGDRVYVAAGAKIIGPIVVGSDSAIGANAVVVKDVEAGVTVGGVPARVISRTGSQDFIEVEAGLGSRS